jgi:hypothetical protein
MTLQRGERYPPGRKAGKAARGPRCTDEAILPCSHSPGVQPYSGGEASQAMSRAAREPRGGGIPVELIGHSAVRSAVLRKLSKNDLFSDD